MRNLCILGATGSIGMSTLDVISQHPGKYNVFSLSANKNWQALAEQCARFHPDFAVIADDSCGLALQDDLKRRQLATRVLVGKAGLSEIARMAEVDIVMAAIVGSAGLLPTLAAVEAGKRVLLANKEALVVAGNIMIEAAKLSGATLIPIDSEHNAIFQCLPQGHQSLDEKGVSQITLTASGGPFRGMSSRQLASVTVEQACKHPKWVMGRKISVDSASLMNKGLELIEAHFLFNAPVDLLQVVIHPESIVHSLVHYRDGSMIAQLGNPDMRTPIAHGLAWPKRITSSVAPLDLTDVGSLNFESPDYDTFPCLLLAKSCLSDTGLSAVILNAANEVAVQAFLERKIRFIDIPQLVGDVMNRSLGRTGESIAELLDLDNEARQLAIEYSGGMN